MLFVFDRLTRFVVDLHARVENLACIVRIIRVHLKPHEVRRLAAVLHEHRVDARGFERRARELRVRGEDEVIDSDEVAAQRICVPIINELTFSPELRRP